jgi:hypothetical protein
VPVTRTTADRFILQMFRTAYIQYVTGIYRVEAELQILSDADLAWNRARIAECLAELRRAETLLNPKFQGRMMTMANWTVCTSRFRLAYNWLVGFRAGLTVDC